MLGFCFEKVSLGLEEMSLVRSFGWSSRENLGPIPSPNMAVHNCNSSSRRSVVPGMHELRISV